MSTINEQFYRQGGRIKKKSAVASTNFPGSPRKSESFLNLSFESFRASQKAGKVRRGGSSEKLHCENPA